MLVLESGRRLLRSALKVALTLVLVVGLGLVLSEVDTALPSFQGSISLNRDSQPSEYLIGVDYFPAYHYNACRFGNEWTPIKFAQSWVVPDEKQPKIPLAYLGYYDDTLSSTWDRQILLATKYGIRFFLIQYFWRMDGTPALGVDSVLDALINSQAADRISFALNWVVEGPDTDYSEQYFTTLLNHIARYFSHPSYLRIDNKPLIAMLHWHSILHFNQVVRSMRMWAKAQGYDDLYIVASALWGPPYDVDASRAFAAGVDAVTNLASPLLGTTYQNHYINGGGSAPYDTLIQPLTQTWYAASEASSAKAVFPFPMSGWDATPWYGKNALVRTGSTPEKFKVLLQNAKDFIDIKSINPKIALIISWNEWGEGHFVEPSQNHGYGYLEVIGRTFNGIDEEVILPSDPVKPEPVVWMDEFVFDDFVSDHQTWPGYGCPENSVFRDSYYGGIQQLVIENINNDGTLTGSTLRYITSGVDPQFWKFATMLNGDVHNTMEIKYRLSTGPAGKSYKDLAIYWTNESDCEPIYGAYGYGNFSDHCAQSFLNVLIPDNNWHVYEAKIRHPQWRGRIWSVRIDLPHIAVPGIRVEIDYIKFKKSQ